MSKEGIYEATLVKGSGRLFRELVGAQSVEEATKMIKDMHPGLMLIAMNVKQKSENEVNKELAEKEAKVLAEKKVLADKKIAAEKKAKGSKKK